jgi:AraC family transcriptional regulator
MSQSGYQERSPQRSIHLEEDLRARSVQPDYYTSLGGLNIYHAIQAPNEYEIAYSYHVLALQVNMPDWHHFRQVNRFAGQEYDGLFPSESSFLLPARSSAFFAWNQTDESILFSIEPTTLQRIAIETDCLNSAQVELHPIVYHRDPKLEFFARAFQEEMQNEGLGGQLYSESLANLFLIHLLRHYCAFEPKLKQHQGGLSKHKLQQAIDYIQAHLDDKLTLEAIAQELNMSVYHFCDLFKQSVGIAPYKYVLQQRVERAKLLLKDEERAIVDIALECGFANQTHLNKHFRKLTGMTPKTYRDGWRERCDRPRMTFKLSNDAFTDSWSGITFLVSGCQYLYTSTRGFGQSTESVTGVSLGRSPLPH